MIRLRSCYVHRCYRYVWAISVRPTDLHVGYAFVFDLRLILRVPLPHVVFVYVTHPPAWFCVRTHRSVAFSVVHGCYTRLRYVCSTYYPLHLPACATPDLTPFTTLPLLRTPHTTHTCGCTRFATHYRTCLLRTRSRLTHLYFTARCYLPHAACHTRTHYLPLPPHVPRMLRLPRLRGCGFYGLRSGYVHVTVRSLRLRSLRLWVVLDLPVTGWLRFFRYSFRSSSLPTHAFRFTRLLTRSLLPFGWLHYAPRSPRGLPLPLRYRRCLSFVTCGSLRSHTLPHTTPPHTLRYRDLFTLPVFFAISLPPRSRCSLRLRSVDSVIPGLLHVRSIVVRSCLAVVRTPADSFAPTHFVCSRILPHVLRLITLLQLLPTGLRLHTRTFITRFLLHSAFLRSFIHVVHTHFVVRDVTLHAFTRCYYVPTLHVTISLRCYVASICC